MEFPSYGLSIVSNGLAPFLIVNFVFFISTLVEISSQFVLNSNFFRLSIAEVLPGSPPTRLDLCVCHFTTETRRVHTHTLNQSGGVVVHVVADVYHFFMTENSLPTSVHHHHPPMITTAMGRLLKFCTVKITGRILDVIVLVLGTAAADTNFHFYYS